MNFLNKYQFAFELFMDLGEQHIDKCVSFGSSKTEKYSRQFQQRYEKVLGNPSSNYGITTDHKNLLLPSTRSWNEAFFLDNGMIKHW